MARVKNPPSPPPRIEETAPPQYVAPPAETTAFDDLIEQCKNASYNLLDLRDGRWCLMTFGSGANLRSFNTLNEGIEFCRDLNLPNVRCLHVEGGVVR